MCPAAPETMKPLLCNKDFPTLAQNQKKKQKTVNPSAHAAESAHYAQTMAPPAPWVSGEPTMAMLFQTMMQFMTGMQQMMQDIIRKQNELFERLQWRP